jgi:sigma-B regulation protein RsbQ
MTVSSASSPEQILRQRHAVTITGQGRRPLIFLHGYGCSQAMWRFTAPAFEATQKVVCYDHIGAGNSDLSLYNQEKYGTLRGYVADLLQLCIGLDLRDSVIVGHSVSAIIGALAAATAPSFFSGLVMVAPSPHYLNDGDYRGGFSREDLAGLVEMLEANYLGWAGHVAGVVMGPENPAWMTAELNASFCRTDPAIATHFAKVTFGGDNRRDLAAVQKPTLILQCTHDLIAPPTVGAFVQRAIAGSELVPVDTHGHCPHISAPDATISAIQAFLTRHSLS